MELDEPRKPNEDIEHAQAIPVESVEDGAKTTRQGVVLVPQPSSDPRDPLNWPQRKKILLLATTSFAAFAAMGSPIVHLIALAPEAKLYGRTPTQIAWSVSAAIAGEAVGPILWSPLAQVCGRSSVIFWCLIGLLVFNVWGATMTRHTQFIPFILSRLFAGLCGAVPAAYGARLVIDVFFIHERGRAFSVLHVSFILGVISLPTLGAFTAAHVAWPNMFWWTVGLLGLASILVFFFLEETGYERSNGKSMPSHAYPAKSDSFVANRIATFFPGNRVVPETTPTLSQIAWTTLLPIIIGTTPPVLIVGLFTLVSFGFSVMLQVLQNVFIELPKKEGGFGFTLQRNAFCKLKPSFAAYNPQTSPNPLPLLLHPKTKTFLTQDELPVSFSNWLSIVTAETYGHFLNDRLPLWICKRRGGVWKPEYRLHSLWIPGMIGLPVGLGIFGAALRYQLSPVLLGFGSFLVGASAFAVVPVTVNYCIECFTNHPTEVGIIMNFYRLSFGLTTSYFVDSWSAKVGVGWVFGMAALFSLLSFGLVVVLLLKGPALRKVQYARIGSTEDGARLMQKEE